MELIKARKAKREQPRNEEKFRFPVLEETWEVSCEAQSEWKQSTAGNERADRVATGLYDIAS